MVTPVCTFVRFSIRARWKLSTTEKVYNMSVLGPSCRGCCVLLDGCEEQRRVLAVGGRRTEGWSLLCKVSLLAKGRNSLLGKPRSSPPHTLFLRHTHTPDVSVPTNTRTISQTPSVVCFFRWSAPRRRSPAWSCAGCSSSSQTLGCSPAPPQFSVAQAPAAKRHIDHFIIMTHHLTSDTMTNFCSDKRGTRLM